MHLNFDANTVYSKGGGGQGRWSSETLIEFTLYTVTVSPNMVADIPCEFRGLNDLEEFIGVL